MDINQRIAHRLISMRSERGLSIEDLSGRSGVSRAMISRIERAESSPTATVLNKLATGFGVLLPELFGPHSYADTHLQDRDPVSSRRNQSVWKDPATGYRRRTLTPSTSIQPLRLSEIGFPPGARVSLDNAFGSSVVQQQLWMLEGRVELQLGQQKLQLAAGDCIAMTLDRPVTVHNATDREARFLVAVLGSEAARLQKPRNVPDHVG